MRASQHREILWIILAALLLAALISAAGWLHLVEREAEQEREEQHSAPLLSLHGHIPAISEK